MNSTTPDFVDSAIGWCSTAAKAIPSAVVTGLSVALPSGQANVRGELHIYRRGNATQQAPNFHDARRRAEFMAVYKALDVLEQLDPSEDYFLESDLANDARHALSLIFMENVPSPKILPHDSETLAFSWPMAGKKVYLTVTEGTASLLESDGMETHCLEWTDIHDGISIVHMLKTLGNNVRATEY